MAAKITCGSLLSTRAEKAHSNELYNSLQQQQNPNRFIEDLLGNSEFELNDDTCEAPPHARFSNLKVSGIPTNGGNPTKQVGHISKMMDFFAKCYSSVPSTSSVVDSMLCKLSSIKDTLFLFAKDNIIADLIRGSDPLTRLAFAKAIENHPYLAFMNSHEKISTLKLILHTINVAILFVNLVVMFSTASSKSVISLQVASIVSSITLFLLDLYHTSKVNAFQNFNIEEMLQDLLKSKLDSEFVSRFDSRREQIMVDLFTNYGKKYNVPESLLNIAKDKLTKHGSEIILCPESSQYFDYAISVAEKTSELLAKFPAIRDSNIVTRHKFDFEMGDGLHQAFLHFKCVQDLHPDKIKELDLMEGDFHYWALVVNSIMLKTPYKNLLMEGFPTLDNQFGTLGVKSWNLYTMQDEETVTAMLPQVGKAACALLALVGAGLTVFAGKNKFQTMFSKAKSFIKNWKDSKSLLTGFKAAFIGIVYELFGWDIGNIHALKKHAKEVNIRLTKCSTISPHTLSANPILRRKMESYQNEALQVLTELTELDMEENKDIIRDIKILNSNISKILADSHIVDSNQEFRVVPTGLYLSGHPSSGKTHFIQQVLGPYLEARFNIQLPQKFSQDASGHFNLVDPSKTDHIFTDELGSRLDDPLIACLNELLSEVPFTAPGAFVKDIKLAPKLVSVCNNEEEIKNQSNTNSFLAALSSRFMQFEVVHQEYDKDASQHRESLTRLPDMSNVDFYEVLHDIQGRRTKTTAKLTALQVCERVAEDIIKKQQHYDYLRSKRIKPICPTRGPFSFSLVEFCKTNLNYKTFVKKEMHSLFSLDCKFTDPTDLYPLATYLRTQICVHVDGENFRIGSGVDVLCCEQRELGDSLDFFTNKELSTAQAEFVQEDSPQDETLYMHIFGGPGKGKTTFLRSKVVELAMTTGFTPYYLDAFSIDTQRENICSEKSPLIVILDDVITIKPGDFQGLYDRIPKGSIVIMVSNIKLHKASRIQHFWYGKSQLYTLELDNNFDPALGWYRRLNLPYPILARGHVSLPNYNTTIMEFDKLNKVEAEKFWSNFTENKFFSHILKPKPTGMKFNYGVLPADMPQISKEVYVSYSSEGAFKSIMSSSNNTQVNFALAMKKINPRMKLVVSKLPTPKDIDAAEFVYFHSGISVESYLLSLLPVFQKIFPEAKGATLEIKNCVTATLENGSIYTTAQNPNIKSEIEIIETGVVVKRDNVNDYFRTCEVMEIITSRLSDIEGITKTHNNWAIIILLCNKDQLKEHFIKLGLIDNTIYDIDMEDPIISKFNEIINSSRFKIFCGIFVTIFTLITLTSIVTLSYALYKMFKGENRDVEISGKEIYVYRDAQANDWYDDIEEEIAAGRHPKDKDVFKPAPTNFGDPYDYDEYYSADVVKDVFGRSPLEQEDYDRQQKEKRDLVKRKHGWRGHWKQDNEIPEPEPLRPGPTRFKLADKHPFLVTHEANASLAVAKATKERNNKRVNSYVSQMVEFTSSTNRKPITDFKVDKLVAAQCRCQSTKGKLMGTFIGSRYVVTCAHLITPDMLSEKPEIKVFETIDNHEVSWNATIIYYGFSRTFKNKKTDLCVLYITDPHFGPKPNLVKYCKTVQDFVDHEANKDVLRTSVCYLSNGVKREVPLETTIGSIVISCFSKTGELQLEFDSPLLSHELSSTRGESSIYMETFVPGSCGLLIFCRDTPSGNGWICGVHTAKNDNNHEAEAFPLYRDQLEYIIQKHTMDLCKVSNLTPEEFKASFDLYGLEQPHTRLQGKLYCINAQEIVCVDCMAKLKLTNYINHECGLHVAQNKPMIHYEFDGQELPCDVPPWWQEVLDTLIREPKVLPECAIQEDKIINTDSLKFLGRSYVKASNNIRPRYKLAPYANRMPYGLQKKPAVLHPRQVLKRHIENVDKVYEVDYTPAGLIKRREVGRNIQSSQIRLMTGGKTDESCLAFFGEPVLHKAAELFTVKLQEVIKKSDPSLQYRFLSDDEVINGITNQHNKLSRHVYGMDLDSEAGPTTSLLQGADKNLKRDLFVLSGKNRDGSDKYELKPEPAKFWYKVRDNAKRGIVTFCPDHLKLKNENLKIEKVDQAKTRAYISRDVFGMMLEKRAIGWLQGLFHMDGCKHFSAIGANPQTDFQTILQNFRDADCTNLICYDVSRWDKNTLRILLERTLKALLKYLSITYNLNQEQINTLKVVFASVLSTYFQTGSDFYYNGRSMPSGTYLTALVNTLLNEFLLCLFVSYIASKTKKSPEKVMAAIRSVFMGDDGVVAFPNWLKDFFEPKRLQQIYAEMNVELTSTTKDGSEIGVVGLMDFEFCSRTVKIHNLDGEQFTVFPLKKISIMSDSHWLTRNCNETKLSICRTKLQEACLWDAEFYAQEVECVKIILSTLPDNVQNEVLIQDWEDQLKSVLFSASTEWLESRKDTETHTPQISQSNMSQDTSSIVIEVDLDLPAKPTDYVSETQKLCQKLKYQVPEYYFDRVRGQDHEPIYRCTSVLDRGPFGTDYQCQEANSKRQAKWLVAKEHFKLLQQHTSQMDRTRPMDQQVPTSSMPAGTLSPIAGISAAPVAPAGDAAFDPMVTTQTTIAPVELVQPSIEDLTPLVNYGDPREWYDAVKTQQLPIRDITFNAGAAPGNIIAKIPYGPEYLAPFQAEYFRKHKFFKGGFTHTLVFYSNATVTGAVRISHVKDIDKDVYTRMELVETNHSSLVQLNQVSMTSNTARTFVMDYAALSDKVLPVKEVVEGTYQWSPSRPGLVITMEVPVQQIFGQNLNLTIQHYTCWGNLVVSTPILTTQTQAIQPGSKTMLEAMQGMTLNTLVASLEPGLEETDIVLTTDGCSYPSTIFTKTREFSHEGIKYGQAATIEFLATTGTQPTANPYTRKDLRLSNAVIMTGEVSSGVGTVYSRLFLLEGDAPFNFDNMVNRDSFEKCLATGFRTSNTANVAFPFPDKGFSNTDACIASIQQGFIDTYNERCAVSLQTFAANPFKLLTLNNVMYDTNDIIRTTSLDLTKRPNNCNAKAVVINLGTLNFRFYVIDIDFQVTKADTMFGYDYTNGKYVISDVFTLQYTPPTSGVSTIPLVSSWKYFNRLPSGCKVLSLLNPNTSAVVTPNGNEGLPTVVDTKFTAALQTFADINTPTGMVCKITLMQSGTGRVVANIYYSTEYKQLFIYSTTTTGQYAAFQGQPSSAFVISAVSFQTPSESFTGTDDSAWSSRIVTPATQSFYRASPHRAQMMLATALQAGLGAVGGIAGGINSAIQQQQDFKRMQILQQERLDYVNRWNQLSAETQLKTNEITNATNLSVAKGNNLTSTLLADKNNANAIAIVDAQSKNRLDLAGINRDTSLSGFQNQLNIAELQAATQLGGKQIDLQIAQGNNATTIEAANIASTTNIAGSVLGLTGSLANTGVGVAKVVSDLIQGDKNRATQIESIHVRGDEDRKTIDHRIALTGGNIAAAQ